MIRKKWWIWFAAAFLAAALATAIFIFKNTERESPDGTLVKQEYDMEVENPGFDDSYRQAGFSENMAGEVRRHE